MYDINNYIKIKIANGPYYSVEYFLFNVNLLKEAAGRKTLTKSGITKDFITKFSRRYNPMDKADKSKPVMRQSSACFASIGYDIPRYYNHTGSHVDCMVYHIGESNHKTTALTRESERRWLKECVKVRYLPKYISVKKIVNERVFIINPTELTSELLYTYLCIVRTMVEEPAVVCLTIDLVDNYGYNFEIAFSIAESCIRSNTGHSFVNFVNGNYGPNKLTTKKVPAIKYAIKIRKFFEQQIKELSVKEKLLVTNQNTTLLKNAGSCTRFGTHSMFNEFSVIEDKYMVTVGEPKNKEINKIFKEGLKKEGLL